MLHDILDLIFPSSCYLCGSKQADALCRSCMSSFAPYESGADNLLDDSVKEFTNSVYANKTHLLSNTASLINVRSAGLYAGNLKEAIHVLKFNNGKRLAQPLAYFMLDKLPALGDGIDAIACVPLTRYKEACRGYNQAYLIARALSKRLAIPIFNGLMRTRETAEQNKLGMEERAGNVSGAFVAKRQAPASLLLIDDVYTTGNTVSECAAALLKAGAGRVEVATIARAKLAHPGSV